MPVLWRCVEAVEPYVAPAAQLVALCGLIFRAVTQKTNGRELHCDQVAVQRCGVVPQRGRDQRPKVGIGIGKDRVV